MSALNSLVSCGTKLWLDSIDPQLLQQNLAAGATGATSNPIIVAELLKSGRFDSQLRRYLSQGLSPEETTWAITDWLVTEAEKQLVPVFAQSKGNDGYVSFEVDPLLEDHECRLTIDEKAREYVRLGQKWGKGHPNRLIKVPATTGGIGALEDLVASGINVNVTLIFTLRQYEAARDAVTRGMQRRGSLQDCKTVYSIFISRLDVYTETHETNLSAAAQGLVGIVNAQQVWQANQKYWHHHPTPLQQEIIFASTGVKKSGEKPWKYVAALAGSDIQTNPPETNAAVAQSGLTFHRTIDCLPSPAIVDEIMHRVDWARLEETLMTEGLAKFAQPHKQLLQLVASKR